MELERLRVLQRAVIDRNQLQQVGGHAGSRGGIEWHGIRHAHEQQSYQASLQNSHNASDQEMVRIAGTLQLDASSGLVVYGTLYSILLAIR